MKKNFTILKKKRNDCDSPQNGHEINEDFKIYKKAKSKKSENNEKIDQNENIDLVKEEDDDKEIIEHGQYESQFSREKNKKKDINEKLKYSKKERK